MTDLAVSPSGTSPVFVDPGGRRHRVLTAVGVGGALLVVAYLLVVIAALTGAPWVPAIGLPGVDAPAAVVPTPDAIAASGSIRSATDAATSDTAVHAVGGNASAADPFPTLVTTPSAVTPPVTSPPVASPPVASPPVASPPVTTPPANPGPPSTLPPQSNGQSPPTDPGRPMGTGRPDGVGGGNGQATADKTG